MNFLRLYVILFLAISMIACGFDEMKSEILFKIPLNEKILNFPKKNGVYYEIPGKMGIEDDMAIISESSARSIKIFNNSKLERVIRSKEFYKDPSNQDQWQTPPNVSKSSLSVLSIPGSIATTSEDSFYVLNYTPQAQPKQEKGKYNFLHIDFDGKLKFLVNNQETQDNENPKDKKLAAQTNEIGFSNIHWMDVDDENRLWLTYGNSQEETILQAYEEGTLLHKFSAKECYDLILKHVEKSKDEGYLCEVFYPFSSGESILFVGKVETIKRDGDDVDETDYTFKERVFISYDIESKKSHKIFTHESDPQESPYLTHGEESFIIWVTEDYQRFKLELYDIKGDQEKKLVINLSGSSHSWRSTYTTLRGKIYSIRISKDFLIAYEWY